MSNCMCAIVYACKQTNKKSKKNNLYKSYVKGNMQKQSVNEQI